MEPTSRTPKFPTIDLTPFLNGPSPSDASYPTSAQSAVAKALDDCFRGPGLFFLHGLPLTLPQLGSMQEVSHKLFSADDATKRATLQPMLSGSNIGYLPFSIERLNRSRYPDVKETFNFQFGTPQDLSGTPTTFPDVARAFWNCVTKAADALAIAFSLALNLSPTFVKQAFDQNTSSVIRLLHYPPYIPSEIDATAIRAGEHTDFGLFTFLFPDGPGLQARPSVSSDDWIDVGMPKETDCIVVLGALMARWTHDHWRAVVHRVITHSDVDAKKNRLSIACFFQPDPEFIVTVPDQFVAKQHDGLCKYEPVRAFEYIQSRLHHSDAGVTSEQYYQ